MRASFPAGLPVADTLLWLPEQGVGFHTRPAIAYDGEYYRKYAEYDATDLGVRLTRARLDLVRRHWSGEMLDIGIGAGLFVRSADCDGYDVNADAVAWLHEAGRFRDPYRQPVEAICCWDSLEHIAEPGLLLEQIQRWLFVSLPIFESAEQCLQSKHYRPGEHIWYWTRRGFIAWCERQGFELVEHNTAESTLGREDIHSFAFRRRSLPA
ncbi:MAG: methyltransferase domain-containing protein [Gammaproteobacteria bacterium]|nr:methyltransferase domain-containing protein [Gammaproteobacteria bacterium]